ncbi:MAG: cytochrome c-type biogenesis protein CcmH [Pseudomonadales bacterium]|nr:cytochrome c-type biogenesis protein CcmH [Pseudomonadales bacterium]
MRVTDRSQRFGLLVLVLTLCGGASVGAAPDAYGAGPVDALEFPSGELEARYRTLIDEFRCPKCLNTNLSGSDAPIAHDLRMTVHRLLVVEGLSDQEVRDFLQSRYGDFVLYDPPFKPSTWLLWLSPFGFLLLGAWALRRMLRQPAADQLSGAERDRLASILRNGE